MASRVCCRLYALPAKHFRQVLEPACLSFGRLPSVSTSTNLLQIKAQEDGQIMEVYKKVGDFCKKDEVIAQLFVQLLDERGGFHNDEEELNMDGCEGLVPHHKEVAVKAEVAGEVAELVADDVSDVEAGQVVAVIEPMTQSAWAARHGRTGRR
mmetsp:Transcript_153635/g.271171  ORF Transcript_153635/g.271171 Transcript_153635/m.271171 type:complete len:153 (-) Transcript_153635:69-527(-)